MSDNNSIPNLEAPFPKLEVGPGMDCLYLVNSDEVTLVQAASLVRDVFGYDAYESIAFCQYVEKENKGAVLYADIPSKVDVMATLVGKYCAEHDFLPPISRGRGGSGN